MPTEALIGTCKIHGIVPIFASGVVAPLLGVYWRSPDLPRPVILLAESLKANQALLRCVLAEEIGHHVTGAADPVHEVCAGKPSTVVSESRAIQWAFDYLMPPQALQAFLCPRGYYHWTPQRLSWVFDVTVGFARGRVLCLMAQRNVQWDTAQLWLYGGGDTAARVSA